MMIRRNAKILVLGAALALALPAVSSAQMSRVEGMAIQGDFIKDWSGMFTYTSQVANVGNLVNAELGVSAGLTGSSSPLDRSVGAVIGNLWEGRLGTWAIHLRQFTPQLGQGNLTSQPSPGSIGFDPNFNPSESFDLIWGKKFGTTSLGLRMNRSFGSLEGFLDNFFGNGPISTIESGTPDDWPFFDPNFNRNVFGLGGGIGFEMNPTSNVEASVLYQRRTFVVRDTVAGTPETYEEDGPTTYQVAARAMWQWQPNIMVVPVFKWYSFDLSTKASAGSSGLTEKNTLKGWQLGAAGNWTLGSNDLFVLGATFAQNKLEEANSTFETTETYAPQVFAALETHVNSWLTVRFGANKGAWRSFEERDPTGATYKRKESDFNMNLGAGVKVGNLQLDAILNDNFPNNLPYFISGSPTSDMFAKVTATYPW